MKRVVIIDDDVVVMESLEALFLSAGYEVQAFGLATDFLAALDGLQPACIVSDLRMPDMDGLALARRLKVEMGLSWPLVLISGHADVAHAVAARNAGVVDFLIKPFPPQSLLTLVNTCCDAYFRSETDGQTG